MGEDEEQKRRWEEKSNIKEGIGGRRGIAKMGRAKVKRKGGEWGKRGLEEEMGRRKQ